MKLALVLGFFTLSYEKTTFQVGLMAYLINIIKSLIMDNPAISLYSQERMVCHLYSLTGPRTNLPKLLTELLGYDRETILQKLKNEVLFTPQDLVKIQTSFKNAALELGMTA